MSNPCHVIKRFLLVDDDIDDASIFCEATNKLQSVECYTAENGWELFDLLSKYGINDEAVIFLDINMPKMDGWECLKLLKGNAEYNSIPIIMYSTSSAKMDVDKAYRLGARLFITKPEDYRELSKILEIIATHSQGALESELSGFKNVKVN